MFRYTAAHRGTSLLCAVALSAALVSGSHGPSPAHAATSHGKGLAPALRSGALATFKVGSDRFKVWVTNPEAIQQLRALRAGSATAHIPNGRILPGPGKAAHNAPWHWHLDPKDINLADMTMEVCDGTPSYVENHITEFVRTVKRYCPWSAKLVGLQIGAGAPRPASSAPANLKIGSVITQNTSAQQTAVTLSWQDRSSDETGFRIHATLSRFYGGVGSQVLDVAPNTTTATIQIIAGGINPLKTACFEVTALVAGAETAPSNRVCFDM